MFKTGDETTQVILCNEIPLLAKRKAGTDEIYDDITATLKEIIPERVYEYYMIAEKYASSGAVEHLASFVHLLPENKVKQQYRKISNIQNTALQERLLWKFGYLSQEMKEYALLLLSQKIEDVNLQEKLLNYASQFSKETYETVEKNLEIQRIKKYEKLLNI